MLTRAGATKELIRPADKATPLCDQVMQFNGEKELSLEEEREPKIALATREILATVRPKTSL